MTAHTKRCLQMTAQRYKNASTDNKGKIMAITTVWIDEGCIVCNACETTCPEVFKVTEESCFILGEVREDGKDDENRDAKSGIKSDLLEDLEDQIEEAAEGCPVEVIKYS